ncbi:BgTH12-06564 [Blumeria graminis f. sp. triticale]|uniref:BgTH12-06564 n=1 Tax=Blumeria graminis f. sp. triticale TaxID=1689686 RepID=A0A9W4GCS2_BLUGR|nr:BgTH12-06564 [Blumeria graminis f. sp. triticale]
MRSTMRQLLGGKKSQKTTNEENRPSSTDLPPNTDHVAYNMRNHRNGNTTGNEINHNTGHDMGIVPSDRTNGEGRLLGNGYNSTTSRNGIPNNHSNGLGNGLVNDYGQRFEQSVKSTSTHALGNGNGNGYGNGNPPINRSLGVGNNHGNPNHNNLYSMRNPRDDHEVLNVLNKDWNENHSAKSFTNPSNGVVARFDGVIPIPNNTRSMQTRSRAMSGISSQPSYSSPNRGENRKVTERSRFISQAPASPPRVLTGAVGEYASPNYLKCENEPIRTPGAIQSVGALIDDANPPKGLKYNGVGDLEVRLASENSRKVIGYGPEQLFALGTFLDVLKEDARDEMKVHVDHCLKNAHITNITNTKLDYFHITMTFPYEPDYHLWCSMHVAPNVEDLVICEFEEYSDGFYLKDVDAARALPQVPFGASDSEISAEDYKKSTTRASKPLMPLQIARQRENKVFSSLDIFSCLSEAQNQITECNDVQEVQDVVVGLVSEITGFHRVMSYRFDHQNNGCVESELVNPLASTDIFRGLNYPASDIPPQARELYKVNRIRILYDRDAETSRLVCRDDEDFKEPLDLSHSYLRAMSPVHSKYLANMGVRSSISISLVIGGNLWALIACHGYGENGIKVSLPVREICRCLGECAAINIQRLLTLERIRTRKLPVSLPSNPNPPSGDLLALIDSDFAVLNIGKKVRAIGRMDPFHEATAIINYLQTCKIDHISSSDNIKADFPELSHSLEINSLAGLLIIPLNGGKENDFLVFFRKCQLRHVNWAGNPNEKIFKSKDDYLQPRKSFQRFIETVTNTSRIWTEDQLDMASILALIYGKFAETWRFKAGFSKENEAEKETEVAPTSVDDTFNLKAAATRVLEALKKEAQRKALDLTVSVHDELPTTVIGDADCFKQVMLYFIRNGFRNSQSLKVDVVLLRVQEDTSYIELKVQDAGPGMSEAELDETFQEFERAQSDEKWPFPSQGSSPNQSENNRSSVTLSVVATFVRSINGQIQVTSELGKGTIFTVELPYKCARGSDGSASRKARSYYLPPSGPPKGPPVVPPPIVPMKLDLAERKARSETSTPVLSAFPLSPANLQPMELSPRPSSGPQMSMAVKSERSSMAHGSNESDAQRHSHVEPKINILVADDDLNSLRMLEEKLTQMGHSVSVARDGQECHDRFALNPANTDVILMELKMPYVDGVLSTRMIRIAEKEAKHRGTSTPQSGRHRVPIIAMSTQLDENSRFDYIQSGLDGWILKPIDFQRLDVVLQGLSDPKMRHEALFVPGQLKKGGWFLP